MWRRKNFALKNLNNQGKNKWLRTSGLREGLAYLSNRSSRHLPPSRRQSPWAARPRSAPWKCPPSSSRTPDSWPGRTGRTAGSAGSPSCAPSSACAPATRVVDPYWFNADPVTAFFLIADPDPDPNADPNPVPDLGFWWPKIEKNLQLEILYLLFWTKSAIYLSLGLP